MSCEVAAEQFALYMTEAYTQPDIPNCIKDLTTSNHNELVNIISAEVHCQMMSMKELLS